MLRVGSFFKSTESRLKWIAESGSLVANRDLCHGHAVLVRSGIGWWNNLEGWIQVPRRGLLGGCFRQLDYWVQRGMMRFLGFPAGDWLGILLNLPRIWRSDLILSTVENVGFPLALMRVMGLWSIPWIYTSIGTPERLERMHALLRHGLRTSLRESSLISCFGAGERDRLDTLVNPYECGTIPVLHWTYGIAVPQNNHQPPMEEPQWDVISVGADPHRDYRLLLEVAALLPGHTFLIIASAAFQAILADAPDNVEVRYDQSMEEVRASFLKSRLVVLPILPNSYSGAVTTALLAMSLGRPVLLSLVEAIRSGYQFRHNENCFLVEPCSIEAMRREVLGALSNTNRLEQVAKEGKHLVNDFYQSKHLEAKVNACVSSFENELAKPAV